MPPEVILTTVWLVVEYAVRIVALGTVPENRRPSSGTAWLLLILFVPAVGIVAYLLLGSPYVHGRRNRIQVEANRAIEAYVDAHGINQPAIPQRLQASLVTLNRKLTALPLVTGQVVRVHPDSRETAKAIAAEIDKARDYVNFEFYILALDSTTAVVFDAFAAAVKRGVTVRVMWDQIGSAKYPGMRRMKRRLTADGVQWREMMPIDPLRGRWRRPDLRNHRKLVVIDGVHAFMGSQNMIDPSYLNKKNQRIGREWVDANIELTGEIVESLDVVFATDWYTEAGELLTDPIDEARSRTGPDHTAVIPAGAPMQLVPSGPGFPTEPNLRQFTTMLYLARQHVRLVSPYFVPDESLIAAITTASYRGIEVELFVSEKADQFMVHHAQRSYYRTLLEAGVRIHTYPAPAVLHTKMITVDGEFGLIGSSNMDMRSFALDYEIMLLGFGADYAARLDAVIDDYRRRSTELDLESWKRRPWWQRYLDNVLRLTSALQ